MSLSFLGFIALIAWRGRSTVMPKPVAPPLFPTPKWRGLGGNM